MTRWKYVGCKTEYVPKEIISDDVLSHDQLKSILKNDIPLVEGEIEALTVDAIVGLLMADGIYPLKIHPYDIDESKLDRLKRMRDLIKNNSPSGRNLKRR